MASNSVFLSPGVYTSEKDLSFVQRQVGVTTLGLVGETTKGPAFQPIFITNYDEFKTFFGGLNPEKFKGNGIPKYELPYIAKSYLSQANQAFVTRVLGLSGYDAKLAWGITMDAALDTTTSGTTAGGTSYTPLFSFTASTAGTITTISSSSSLLQTIFNTGASCQLLQQVQPLQLLLPLLNEVKQLLYLVVLDLLYVLIRVVQ